MAENPFLSLSESVRAQFDTFGKGTTKRRARSEEKKLEDFGIFTAGLQSDDEEIADWEKMLWGSQDDMVWDRHKEWLRNLYYCAGNFFIAWHKVMRRWVPRKSAPWRIRSSYNVVQKAVNLRVARLTENKPMVTVQASTTDREDVERAEYKESLFWQLWNKLEIQWKITVVRRWASKCGIGVLKVGFDPDAGPPRPVTVKRLRFEEQPEPILDAQGLQATDPTSGEALQRTVRVYTGIAEIYVDADGNELGPTERMVDDQLSSTGRKLEKQEPPDGTDFFNEGEVFIDVLSPFNIRWDRYAENIYDSWYVQESEIMPATEIASLFPDKLEKLKEARLATADEKLFIIRKGLNPVHTSEGSVDFGAAGRGDSDNARHDQPINKEYVVRRTWIFPQNDHLKRLWGTKGALLVTVGGALIHKSALPEHALLEYPFIRFVDTLEEGNHYEKSFLRDLIPIQDDINRTRSQMAESVAIRSRVIFGALQNHQINIRTLAQMPGAMLTYRSPAHEPKPLDFGRGDSAGADKFYVSSLQAAQDIGNMNDASTGKLPSAALAARAIYALQFADERSIAEVSNLQDASLSRLAKAIDAVVRTSYKETRKIQIVGLDRSFMATEEVPPEAWQVDVDYHFLPGSMLSKNKENIRNEMIQLLQLNLIEPFRVRKYLASSVPDVFRQSYDLQEAKARRVLSSITRGEVIEYELKPWDNPEIFKATIEEYLLSAKSDLLGNEAKNALTNLWSGLTEVIQQQQQAQLEAQIKAKVAEQTQKQEINARAKPPDPTEQQEGQEDAGFEGLKGAQQLQRQATAAMTPPGQFGR